MSALGGLLLVFGPPASLLVSIVAVVVDKPKGFAVAGLIISLVSCLMIGGLFAAALCS